MIDSSARASGAAIRAVNSDAASTRDVRAVRTIGIVVDGRGGRKPFRLCMHSTHVASGQRTYQRAQIRAAAAAHGSAVGVHLSQGSARPPTTRYDGWRIGPLAERYTQEI